MEFGKVIANPVVLGAGAIIGIALLAKGSSGNSNSAATSGNSPVVISAVSAMNRDALAAEIQAHTDNANLAGLAYTQDTARQAQFLSYLTNNDNNRSANERQRIQSQAGVVGSQIAAATAVQVDLQQNINRMAMAYVDVNKVRSQSRAIMRQSDNSVEIAKAQASAQKHKSFWGAIGGIIGTVANVGLGIATGGASLAAEGLGALASTVASPSPSPVSGSSAGVWA